MPRAQSRIGPGRRAWAALLAVLLVHAVAAPLGMRAEPEQSDPVVARVYQHLGDGPRPILLAVDAGSFSPAVWNRVKHLVAFRLQRHQPDGTTLADASTYLIRDSTLYAKAAAALRNHSTHDDYVWCLLAAVIAHEAQHTAPNTERQALIAEVAQLRRCLLAGHLYSAGGWSAVSYLGKVEAKLRHPREHY